MMNLCIVDACNFDFVNENQEYDFRNYSTWQDGKWRSWHSVCAALKTEYFVYGSSKFNNCLNYDGIIILLDKEFQKIVPFLKKLKVLKKKIIIGYHEGSHLVDNTSLEQIIFLKDIVNEYADYYLNINVPTHGFWVGLFNKPVISINSCAPFYEYDWEQYNTSRENKKDIFVATRTLRNDRLKRDTLKALVVASRAAKELDCKVIYINEDAPYITNDFFKRVSDRIECTNRKENYEEWLKFLSGFRVAFQLDNSNSVGQVVTDCALARTVCLGGNCDNSIQIRANVLDTEDAFSELIEWYNQPGWAEKYLYEIKDQLNFGTLKNQLEEIK